MKSQVESGRREEKDEERNPDVDSLTDLVHTAEELPVKHHQLIGYLLCRHVMELTVTRRPVDLFRKRKLTVQETNTHTFLTADV